MATSSSGTVKILGLQSANSKKNFRTTLQRNSKVSNVTVIVILSNLRQRKTAKRIKVKMMVMLEIWLTITASFLLLKAKELTMMGKTEALHMVKETLELLESMTQMKKKRKRKRKELQALELKREWTKD